MWSNLDDNALHGATAPNGEMMKRPIVWLATTALVSGGMALAGVGAGTANATCPPGAVVNGMCYGPNHWCPGDSLYSSKGGPNRDVNWDMNVCHTWYWVAEGAGNVSPVVWDGDNPPPPPGPPVPGPGAPPLPPGMCWAMWVPAPCPNG
ncbi:MAG: hypothetical protein QOH57_1109 [Mycobacterium sp.]|nr:hypothetical protein [Mycobacterium sp.]